MSATCQLCSSTASSDARLCHKHIASLADMIDPNNSGRPGEDVPASIPVLYAMLDPTPGGGGGGNDERRAPGFRSTPAASPHVVVMTDDRSRNDPQTWYDPHPSGVGDDWTRPHTEESNPPRAIRKALEGLVDALAEDWGLIGPRLEDGAWLARGDVQALCAHLYAERGSLAAHVDAGELYEDLLELSDQLRRAVGDADPGVEGWCIELVRDRHGSGYRECGGPLRLLPPVPDPPGQTHEQAQKIEVARCPRCHRRYSWLDLIRAKLAREAASGASG
ncbi:MAG: hypothetical protein ACRDZO_27990 [Egibacteraceae bacterium]